MRIEKGKLYRCIKSVIMDDGEIAYIQGRLYAALYNNSLLDESGDEHHIWAKNDNPELHFEEYKKPTSINWEQRRFEVAKELLPALVNKYCHTDTNWCRYAVEDTIKVANLLIQELSNK